MPRRPILRLRSLATLVLTSGALPTGALSAGALLAGALPSGTRSAGTFGPLVGRAGAATSAPMLRSGTVSLAFSASAAPGGGFGIALTDSEADAPASVAPTSVAPTPVTILVCAAAGGSCTRPAGPASQTASGGGYTTAPMKTDAHTVSATAIVETPGGSTLIVDDRYSTRAPGGGALPTGSFRLARTVSVAAVGAGDAASGFNSQFRMGLLPRAAQGSKTLSTSRILAPARWNDRNTDADPTGPARNPAAPTDRTGFFRRETRGLPPLIVQQDPATGEAFALAQLPPPPVALGGEDASDAAAGVTTGARDGSIGAARATGGGPIELGFSFPAEETVATAPDAPTGPTSGRAARRGRSTPLAAGQSQGYSLLLSLRRVARPVTSNGTTVVTGAPDIAKTPAAELQAWNAVTPLSSVPPGRIALHAARDAGLTPLERQARSARPGVAPPRPFAIGFAGAQEQPFQSPDRGDR